MDISNRYFEPTGDAISCIIQIFAVDATRNYIDAVSFIMLVV